MSVQSTITVEELTDRGLITHRSGDTFELTQEIQRAIDETDQPTSEHPVLQNHPRKAHLLEVCENDTAFLHKYVAVAERVPDLPFEEQLTLVLVIDQFIQPRLPFDGVPESFLPVRGAHLETALTLHPQAVVYAWRRNCDGCDVMKETFTEVFDGSDPGCALFAVYGPNCAALLQEQFDVHGAPTTLFCANGSVDSRLVGAQHAGSVASEVEILGQVS